MAGLIDWVLAQGAKVLFAGVFIGLLLPDLAALCRPLLAPAVALLLFVSLLRIEWERMFDYVRRPVLVALVVAWTLVLTPLLVWLMHLAAVLPPSLSTAIVLMAAAPPIISAPSIALLLGLDAALAMVGVLVGTLLVPIVLPPLVLLLLGLELEIAAWGLMLRLGLLVGGTFALAAAARRMLGLKRLRRHARAVDLVIVATMLVFAIAIMDGVTAVLYERPAVVAGWVLASFVANIFLQVAGALVFVRLGSKAALTLGLLSGNCNMGLLLATLPPGTEFDIVLYFALAQLPMYMLPAAQQYLYRYLHFRSQGP